MSKPNPGWFRKGLDNRRHELTREERQRGYANARAKLGKLKDWRPYAWLWRRVRSYYRRARRKQ